MKRILCVFMTVLLVFSVFTAVSPETTQAASVSISQKNRTIAVNQQFRLYLNNCKSKVTWSSKNVSVAKVSKKGIVTGVGIGTTKILAKVGKSVYTCDVKVIEGLPNELSVVANHIAMALLNAPENRFSITDTVSIESVEKGIYTEKNNQDSLDKMSWDYKICGTILKETGTARHCIWYFDSENCRSGEYDAVLDHFSVTEKTDITYSSNDVEKVQNRIQIIIKKQYDPFENDRKIRLNCTDVTLCVGDTYQLSVENTKTKVIWSSGNSKVASVSKGKVTARKAGTVKIKAVVEGMNLSATVYVVKKFSKDLRNAISFLSEMPVNYAYPDEFKVTDIELGKFKTNGYTEANRTCFARVSVMGRSVNGKLFQGYFVLCYYKSAIGKTSVEGSCFPQSDNGYCTPTGKVTHCTSKEIKEVNELIHSGKGRLLIEKY